MKKPDEMPENKPFKSEEYKNFENGLKRILSVSKKDLDTKLAEEQKQKQSAQEPRQS